MIICYASLRWLALYHFLGRGAGGQMMRPEGRRYASDDYKVGGFGDS
jgi:hypothetical protein